MSDPRTLPANGRVAAEELRGLIEAERFAAGELTRVAVPVADLSVTGEGPRLDRQLLCGDRFRVLERRGGLAFGQAGRGGYVGYVSEDALGPWAAPTHVVAARNTLAFAAPDIKHPDPLRLSLGASLTVEGEEGGFARLDSGRFVPLRHLRPADAPEADPVAVAERLAGVPYLWGGNSADGIDCSGLVQLALLACGIECPGDSDLQRAAFAPVRRARRGDLIFWQGHVAICVTSRMLIHANAHAMAVSYEPRAACIARIRAAEGKEILKIARPGSTPQ